MPWQYTNIGRFLPQNLSIWIGFEDLDEFNLENSRIFQVPMYYFLKKASLSGSKKEKRRIFTR